jgi:hypothetical protein
MKNSHLIRFPFLVIVMAVLALSSCKKDKSDTPQPIQKATATASVNAVDNGESFSFYASPQNIAAGMIKDSLALSFTDTATQTQIIIGVFPVHAPGSFTFDENNDPYCVAIMNLDGEGTPEVLYISGSDTDGDGKTDGTGTLKITSLTKDHIKGTFSMTMYNYMKEKTVVSDGKFDCPLVRR